MAPRLPLLGILAAGLAARVLADAQVKPSKGCSDGRLQHRGRDLVKHVVEVADFEHVNRSFFVQAPAQRATGAKRMTPAPLLFSFHGQTESAKDFAQAHHYGRMGRPHGLVSVFPQGMDDARGPDDQGTGWNVGSGGAAGNATCIPQGVGEDHGCYRSCRKLGRCGRCNWSTCYNDVLFFRTMLAKVTNDFCIDMNRIYLHGESNGGMMVTHLVREMPEIFAGVSPWFGTPMLGFLMGSEFQLLRRQADVAKTALLTLHARSDVTIPPSGGVSEDGWIFESESSVRGVWAAIHGCKLEHVPLPTKWDGGPLDFRCHEHQGCSSGRRVVGCRYAGTHGDWPTGKTGDEITLWFLLQFSRGQPAMNEQYMV